MNKTKFILLLCCITFSLGTTVFAQRNIDLSVNITAPSSGLVLAYGDAPVLVTFDLKNNGPNNLVAGDTLFFALSINNGNLNHLILGGPLNSGQTMPLDLGLGIQNPGTLTADQEVDVCLLVLDPNSSGITANGVPVFVSYNDANMNNNESCIKVTIKAHATDISDVQTGNQDKLTIYPNPARSEINFYANEPLAENTTVTLMDVTGKTVLTKTLNGNRINSTAPCTLDVSALKKGLYLLRVNSGKLHTTHKVMLDY